ncbi:MAG: MATE family efflux transporter [Eubacterium sp.]|nr:MATE family efflux transporter [Eubacterium sp.]
MIKLLNDKKFWKKTLKIALPIAIQNALISSFTLVDTVFVSSLGDVSLSAVGMCSQWSFLMNLVIFGICSATGVFVSQYWGVKDEKRIHKTLGIALSFGIIVSLIFASFSFFAPHFVIGLFNKDAAVIREGTKYLVTIGFMYPAFAIDDILNAVLRSCEKPRLPMIAAGVTTVANIFLDYCLIFGKLGFPEMGVRGAALATVISAWLGVATVVGVSFVQRNIIITKFSNVFKYTKKDIKVFLNKATPVIVNESLWGLGIFICNLVFANMGYEYYAAVSILKTIENLTFVFFVGFSAACSVLIGNSIGAGNIKRRIEDSKRFIIIIPVVSIIVGIVAIILRAPLVSLFDMGENLSALTLNTAKTLILIYSLTMPARMLGFTFIVGILRSGGNTFAAAKFDLSSIWLSSLPAVLISAYVLKLPFLVCFTFMYIFEDVLKLILCIPHYRSLKWIKPVTDEGREALEVFKNE